MVRRLILVALTWCCAVALSANVYISKRYQDNSLANDNINLPQILQSQATEFRLVKTFTDFYGMEHTLYEQYFNGIKIDGAQLLVHRKNGYVKSINGQYLPDEQLPEYQSAQSRIAPQDDRQIVIFTNPKDGKLYTAYLIYDIKCQYKIYLDAATGNELYRIPLMADSEIMRTNTALSASLPTTKPESAAVKLPEIVTEDLVNEAVIDVPMKAPAATIDTERDVVGTAMTKYNGQQPMTSVEVHYSSPDTTVYFSADYGRNILTFDAQECYFDWDQIGELRNSSQYDTYFNSALDPCKYYTSPSVNWQDMEMGVAYFYNVPYSSWYFVVTNSSGTIKYASDEITTSNYQQYCAGVSVKEGDRWYICIVEDNSYVGKYRATAGAITEANKYSKSWDDGVRISVDVDHASWLDVHYSMQYVYDYYKNSYNRTSYDDNGGQIINLVNKAIDDVFENKNNANAWGIRNTAISIWGEDDILNSWGDFMCYGTGDGSMMNNVVGFDVMAHEYTHLVTYYNAGGGLEYSGETGALNEAFSDIMAVACGFYTGKDADWLIGEDVMIPVSNIRSLANPKVSLDGYDPQPDTYQGQYWQDVADLENDNGGVHTNSGVPNKWFYLLCEGGSGTNDKNYSYNISGIGIDKASQIAYLAFEYYMTYRTSFVAAANATLDAAEELYGSKSNEWMATLMAWRAVNVWVDNAQYYLIEVSANNDEYGTVSGGGYYQANQSVTLTATPVAGYEFKRWSNGITNNPYTFTATQNGTYTAVFEPIKYHITVAANNSSYGTVTGGGDYAPGQSVTIVATPNTNYRFVNWSNGATTASYTFTATQDLSLTANFAADTRYYNINALSNNEQYGTVSGGGQYAENEQVTLVATPTDGYEFKGWSNGEKENPLIFAANGDLTLIATFEKIPTAIEQAEAEYVLYAQKGTIYVASNVDFVIYNLAAENVTPLNGTLPAGIYIVKIGDKMYKIMMK